MNRLDRQIVQLCQDVIHLDSESAEDGAPSLSEMARDAGRIMAHFRRPKRPGPAREMRKGPTRAEDKAAKDAARQARWNAIKGAVLVRAESHSNGRCEWLCGSEIADPHHLIGGSGRRRVEESPETVAAICRECHDGYEANDPAILDRARAWAEWHGFWRALGAIDRRIAKAKATQRYLDSQHGRVTR